MTSAALEVRASRLQSRLRWRRLALSSLYKLALPTALRSLKHAAEAVAGRPVCAQWAVLLLGVPSCSEPSILSGVGRSALWEWLIGLSAIPLPAGLPLASWLEYPLNLL